MCRFGGVTRVYLAVDNNFGGVHVCGAPLASDRRGGAWTKRFSPLESRILVPVGETAEAEHCKSAR